MKRSSHIKLVLLGGLTTGALTSCAPHSVREPRITPASVYANDYHVPGAGYYHAPFHAFFPQPYNYYDAQRKLYYYGGQWGPAPYRSVINVSEPTVAAAQAAEGVRTDIIRGGFGSTGSSGYHIWS